MAIKLLLNSVCLVDLEWNVADLTYESYLSTIQQEALVIDRSWAVSVSEATAANIWLDTDPVHIR